MHKSPKEYEQAIARVRAMHDQALAECTHAVECAGFKKAIEMYVDIQTRLEQAEKRQNHYDAWLWSFAALGLGNAIEAKANIELERMKAAAP